MSENLIDNLALEASGSEMTEGVSFLPFLQNEKVALFIFTLLVLAVFVLKAFALWQAARKKHTFWFIAIFVLNTFGLLELSYIFVLSKLDWHKILEQFGVKVKKQALVKPVSLVKENKTKVGDVKKSSPQKKKTLKPAKKKVSKVKKK